MMVLWLSVWSEAGGWVRGEVEQGGGRSGAASVSCCRRVDAAGHGHVTAVWPRY